MKVASKTFRIQKQDRKAPTRRTLRPIAALPTGVKRNPNRPDNEENKEGGVPGFNMKTPEKEAGKLPLNNGASDAQTTTTQSKNNKTYLNALNGTMIKWATKELRKFN